MRFTSSVVIFPLLIISYGVVAVNAVAPQAPDQPDISQDGLIAKIRWASQTAGTDAFVSQSVNGSVWSNEVKVPFQHYDSPIELGKSYSYRVKVCNSEGVGIDPPIDTWSLRTSNPSRSVPMNRTLTTSLISSGISSSTNCSDWSYSTLIHVPALQIQSPIISPRNVEFNDSVNITLNSMGTGVVVRYELNNNEVSSSSPVFPTMLSIKSSSTISLKAFKVGYANSDIATFYFNKISTISSSKEFKYDELGRLTQVEESNGNTVEYILDDAGNRIQIR